MEGNGSFQHLVREVEPTRITEVPRVGQKRYVTPMIVQETFQKGLSPEIREPCLWRSERRASFWRSSADFPVIEPEKALKTLSLWHVRKSGKCHGQSTCRTQQSMI